MHPIPRAKVQTGEQLLREGESCPLVDELELIPGDEPAAFGVRFTGTPPFSFTYTRSESTLGSKSRVIETQVSNRRREDHDASDAQTITDIMEQEYRITSSLPGDYEVTSVSDKYCRYPPLSRGRD